MGDALFLFVVAFVIVLGLAGTRRPQNLPRLPMGPQREITLEELEARSGSDVRQKIAERRAAEEERREFARRAVDFMSAWDRLSEVANKGGWNPKMAKEVRKKFEKLVSHGAWMESKD